jgi:hypothetical protein
MGSEKKCVLLPSLYADGSLTTTKAPQSRARRVRHNVHPLVAAADYVSEPRLAPCRLFHGYWPDTNARGLTTLVVEQVSHHPPITAYYIANSSRGVTLEGHNAQKTSFSGKLLLNLVAAS